VASDQQTFILRNADIKQRTISYLEKLPVDPPYEIIIRPHKSKRTLSQNSFMWLLFTAIANHEGEASPHLAHQLMCDLFLPPPAEYELYGHTLVDPDRTKKLSVEEETAFLEKVLMFMAAKEIPIPERNYVKR
jgi:hypothetical protein